MTITKFKAFVLLNVPSEKHGILHNLLDTNNVALGKIFSKPETARTVFILNLSDLIDVHPYTLINEYNLGKKHLSDREVKEYRDNYLLEQQELAQSQS